LPGARVRPLSRGLYQDIGLYKVPTTDTLALGACLTVKDIGKPCTHHFFVAYDKRNDLWLKFDVVKALRYGKPIRALCLDMTERCLRNRRWRSPTYVLSLEDEFATLLLHIVYSIKRAFVMLIAHALLIYIIGSLARKFLRNAEPTARQPQWYNISRWLIRGMRPLLLATQPPRNFGGSNCP